MSVEVAPEASELRVALVGNPNVGKSTLFNELTGLRQRVANYPGVTVDAREGDLAAAEGRSCKLLDLPGTYSLRPRANDEAVVERVLLGGADDAGTPDAVVVVLDATNLRRNLFLLSEVIDLGLPLVVALNMVDEARRAGQDVPSARLRDLLGVPVVETVASRGEGIAELRAALTQARPAERRWTFADGGLEERLRAMAGDCSWRRLKALEGEVDGLRAQEVAARYAWISAALHGAQAASSLRARSDRIDRFLLHPVLGPLIFLTVMALVFQSIFTGAEPLMGVIEAAFGALSGWLSRALPALIGETGTSLVVDGAVAGVGAVVVFLPQIVILFLLLGLLEDTGYMARAAFLVDRPLRTLGLSGRSFIPLLSSFACAIPGVMATRTIPSRFERLLAIFIAPLMTCSARLPVYALLIAAFVPETTVLWVLNLQGLVLLALYLAGIGAGGLLAFVATRAARSQRRGRELPMVVELPPYRRPAAKGVLLKLGVRAGDFLKRAGTVIFVVSIVLWAMLNFPRAPLDPAHTPEQQAAAQIDQSLAGRLGHALEPAIAPLGYDWKMGVGLIASFAAREVFVSTMGIVYSLGAEVDEGTQDLHDALRREVRADGRPSFSLATVFSLLAFYVFALQCGATVAVVRRESGSWRFALAQLFGYLLLAYLAALGTYQAMSAAGYG